MLSKIEINGIDVTSYCINWEYEKSYGDVLSEINLKFVRTINNILTIQNGMTLEVWRGWITATDFKIFSGYIEKYELEGGTALITGIDKLWDLVRKEINYNYDSSVDISAGKISAIFTDIVTTHGGLNADVTTVQDSGTVVIIDKFPCNHTDPFERCKKLASVLDWQFYYKVSDDKVYFEPKGFTNNLNILTVGTDIINVPKWQKDITEMANDITIVGAYQEIETTKSGRIGTTSGFTTTGISLDYEPISVKVYGDASNPPTTLKTGGMPDSTTTYDYYVDKVKKKILPKNATTFTTNDYYEIRYSFAAPIPVNNYNQDSIDTYGRFQKTITLKDIRSVADAEQRVIKHLEAYSVPFIYSTLKVKNSAVYNLDIGQNIQIIDNVNTPNVNSNFIINKIRMKYPGAYDEIDIGDKYWRLADFQSTVMEKLKRIEEEEFANQDIINKLITVDTSILSTIPIENRYVKVQTNTLSGTNVFILGNSAFGVLGTNQLGDTGIGADTNHCIIQNNNYYTELFYDNDFKGTGDATWDTTAKTLSGIATKYQESTSIDYNNGTLNTVTINVTANNSFFTIYASADGGTNWAIVSNNIAFNFLHTGIDLRYKIIFTGNSTISKIEVYNYH